MTRLVSNLPETPVVIRAVARKYATDPEYANKVIRLMDLYDLRRFDS